MVQRWPAVPTAREDDRRAAPGRGRPRAPRSWRCCRRARAAAAEALRRPRRRPRGPCGSSRWPRPAARAGRRPAPRRRSRPPIDDLRAGRPAHRRTARSARSNSAWQASARERRLLRRLPDHRVAADQGERRVPGPDRDREVEGGDDADHAERVPGLASCGGPGARRRWSGRRAGATGRPRSRRCRSSPALRPGPPAGSCRPRA